MLDRIPDVTVYKGNTLSAEEIIEFSSKDNFDYSHVMLATG